MGCKNYEAGKPFVLFSNCHPPAYNGEQRKKLEHCQPCGTCDGVARVHCFGFLIIPHRSAGMQALGKLTDGIGMLTLG